MDDKSLSQRRQASGTDPVFQANDASAPPAAPAQPERPPIAGFSTPLQKPRPQPIVETVPPPPVGGPVREKGSGALKRLLIGVVAIIFITFLVIFFLPKGQPQKVTLVWWGLWEDGRVMQPLIADFEKDNPTITVEYSKQDPKQYRERLLTRIQNGNGPDIFRFHNTWYPMFSEALLPLSSDVITQDEFKKSFYPVMQSDLIHNGAIYGIPLGADSLSLFVNTEVLNAAGVKPPTTWDEFVKAAKTLTVKDENGIIKTAGAAFGTYGNVTHAPDIIALLLAQQGVAAKTMTASSQDQIDAIDFYTSFATGTQNTWDSKLDPSLTSFAQGKAAMYFGYSWDIFAIQKLNKDLAFKTYPVPSLYNRNMTIASYWVEGASTKSTHQKEALLFMHFLSKKETAQKFYTETAKTRSFGEPYARVDLADTLKSNAIVYPFISQLKNATSSFFASDTADGEGGINSMSNSYLGTAVDSIVNDGSSVGSAVDILDQGMQQVMTKYAVQ